MTESNYKQWLLDNGYGWTPLQFYRFLEMNGFDGPAVHMWRAQFLRTGDCTLEGVDISELHALNDHWYARFSDGL